jgi:deazaflavin-dependent oxidoreductase (nitroreductase family)
VGTNHPDADRNRQTIDHLRNNEGRMSYGDHELRFLILHSIGAKTGEPREHPLAYAPVGEAFAVFASNGARKTHPAWYYNLIAHPECRIEVGTENIAVRARVTEGQERETIWTAQKEFEPGFAEYEGMTTRTIPVVVLERV